MTQILTVSQLTQIIKKRLEAEFPDLWVEGEVSNLRIPASGHLYFTLKDEASQIKTVVFRSSARFLKFRPKDGQKLLCRAHVMVYEPKGEYQLAIDYLEPKGLGALQQAFEQLKERLAREGLFDESRKRPLPVLPKKIGIVTSPTGAVIRDMLQILDRRYANLEILIDPVPVQGTVAAKEIARAIEELNLRGDLDVIILARGGGSIEDLWSFNEEVVARAIYHSRVPLISAVGHETDYTIADFVADLRAPTPSAAAELVIGRKTEMISRLELWAIRLQQTFMGLLERWRGQLQALLRGLLDPRRAMEGQFQRLDELDRRVRRVWIQTFNQVLMRWEGFDRRLLFVSPLERWSRQRLELNQRSGRLAQRMEIRIQLQEKLLEKWTGKLDALSPLAILARGYSIARRFPLMTLIREAKEIKRGDLFHLTLHRGSLISRVEEVRADGEDQKHTTGYSEEGP
jgi:exodeoxyribonuclease VII large subunit